MARCKKKCVHGERLREGIKCAKDRTKEQHTRPGRKGWKLCWHDNPAGLKLPTTSATLLTLSIFWYLILSSVAKTHASCSCSPHNVLHSPSIIIPIPKLVYSKDIVEKFEKYAVWCEIVCKSFVSRIMNLKICVKNSFSHGNYVECVGFWLLDVQELSLSGEVECDLEGSDCAQSALVCEWE